MLSTKGALCSAVPDRIRFIGGHPVCGSEARGPGHGSAELFDGATWFLTPVAATEPARYRLLHGFVASLGAVPVAIDPDAHDRLELVRADNVELLLQKTQLLSNTGGEASQRPASPESSTKPTR